MEIIFPSHWRCSIICIPQSIHSWDCTELRKKVYLSMYNLLSLLHFRPIHEISNSDKMISPRFLTNKSAPAVISHKQLQIFRSPGHVTSRDRGTMRALWESVTWGQRSVTRGSVTAWQALTSHHPAIAPLLLVTPGNGSWWLQSSGRLAPDKISVWIFAPRAQCLHFSLHPCLKSPAQCHQHYSVVVGTRSGESVFHFKEDLVTITMSKNPI